MESDKSLFVTLWLLQPAERHEILVTRIKRHVGSRFSGPDYTDRVWSTAGENNNKMINVTDFVAVGWH